LLFLDALLSQLLFLLLLNSLYSNSPLLTKSLPPELPSSP
jgi:hypothetical protein